MSARLPASYSPLLLEAQITVPGGGGDIGLADTTRMENPFQGPMWLDEIRFRMPSGGTAWSSVYAKLLLGNIPLTHGYVPISLFGKVLNDSVGAELATTAHPPNVFTWRLPKPLFIPARELLRPSIYFQPFSGAPDTTPVTILYACRPLPVGTPTPQKLQIPWVTPFVPAMLATGTTDQVDDSQPSDLYNPWDQDLHVQRFVGRLMGQNLDGEDVPHTSLASAQVNMATNQVSVGTLITAQDSFNNILIRDPTPFAHVFDFVDRAWTVNAVLPPKGFYMFNIERLWSGYSAGFTMTTGISMVGWREVAYAS